MSKNFFIVTEGMDKANRDALTKWLRTKTWGFNHWLDPIWLLSGLPENYTAQTLYGEVSEILPDGEPDKTLVVCVENPMTYWGKGSKAMWDWMKLHWGTAG